MADISEVLTALAGQVAAVVYPSGTGHASVGDCDIKVYPGWPNAATLDADLAANKVHISVYPTSIERRIAQFQRRWVQASNTAPTITLALNGLKVTVGGAVPVPFSAQNLAILLGSALYMHALQQADTMTSIATALASQIPGASSSGPVITLPPGPTPVLRVGGTGTAVQEIRRQRRVVQITIWAPTPGLRDKVAKAVDAALADMAFITLPDGTGGHLSYQDSPMTDDLQKALLYRRDLRYAVEFGTTKQMTTTTVVAGVVTQETTTTAVQTTVKAY